VFERHDHVEAPLYVATVVFNPIRYRSRWKLYEDFKRHVEASGAILYTAEVAFGHRNFCITELENPRHLQLRTETEIWHKEKILNLLIQRLPVDWKYVATVDADVSFVRGDWANETIHQLQHYQVVQMWSQAEDLNSHNEGIQNADSFVFSWMNHIPEEDDCYYAGTSGKHFTWHPGFAWAYRRAALESLGGLIDFGIVGSGDRHMAKALIGEVDGTIQAGVSDAYRFMLQLWEDRALRYIKKNIGYVPGKLLHYWHGPKVSRQYFSRWQILTDNQFDPVMDLKPDTQGLYQLVVEESRQITMRDQLRQYFRTRNEDQLS